MLCRGIRQLARPGIHLNSRWALLPHCTSSVRWCSTSASADDLPRPASTHTEVTHPPHSTNATSVVAGPYRRVGNVFIVTCADHPFKFPWEVNRMLRELRLEFKGQTVIVPDIPSVRRQLWRTRHVVRVDMLDLDEAKALVGVPEHVSFRDLNAQIPATFGRIRGFSSPVIRSKANFMRLRRMRLRDVLHRDALEKRLLEEKRKLLQKTGSAAGRGAVPPASANVTN